MCFARTLHCTALHRPFCFVGRFALLPRREKAEKLALKYRTWRASGKTLYRCAGDYGRCQVWSQRRDHFCRNCSYSGRCQHDLAGGGRCTELGLRNSEYGNARTCHYCAQEGRGLPKMVLGPQKKWLPDPNWKAKLRAIGGGGGGKRAGACAAAAGDPVPIHVGDLVVVVATTLQQSLLAEDGLEVGGVLEVVEAAGSGYFSVKGSKDGKQLAVAASRIEVHPHNEDGEFECTEEVEEQMAHLECSICYSINRARTTMGCGLHQICTHTCLQDWTQTRAGNTHLGFPRKLDVNCPVCRAPGVKV